MTNDMDIWVRPAPDNALRVLQARASFGFNAAKVDPDLFVKPNSIVRMGVPPLRVEILTTPSGVDFDTCFAECIRVGIEEIRVPVISLQRLRQNKASAGRAKDLADLENLPKPG